MDASSLTAAGNAVFVVPSLIVMLVALGARRRAHTRWGQLAITGLALAAFAIVLRIGQWLVALITRPLGEVYAPWIFDVRDLVTIIAATIFVAGCTTMVYGLARRSDPWFWAASGAAVGVVSAWAGYWLAELVPMLL